MELAEVLLKLYEKKTLRPQIDGAYRKGDIRHCYADTRKAKKLINFTASVSLGDGLAELSKWSRNQKTLKKELFEKALSELKAKQLVS